MPFATINGIRINYLVQGKSRFETSTQVA